MRDRILKRMTDYYDLDERLYECVEDLLTELAPIIEKARKYEVVEEMVQSAKNYLAEKEDGDDDIRG